MDPDPDPGGQKHTDPDSNPDPQHWYTEQVVFALHILRGSCRHTFGQLCTQREISVADLRCLSRIQQQQQ
jgi:hypothetical protein